MQDAVGVLPRAAARPRAGGRDPRDGVRRRHATPSSRCYAERLTWRVTYRAASDAVYDAMVDADTGHVLQQRRTWSSRRRPRSSGSTTRARRSGGTQLPVDLETARLPARRRDELDGPNVHAFVGPRRRQRRSTPARRSRATAARSPSRSTHVRRHGLRRVAPVLVGPDGRRQLEHQPRAERRPGLLPRQPLPRPPGGRSASLDGRSRAPTS